MTLQISVNQNLHSFINIDCQISIEGKDNLSYILSTACYIIHQIKIGKAQSTNIVKDNQIVYFTTTSWRNSYQHQNKIFAHPLCNRLNSSFNKLSATKKILPTSHYGPINTLLSKTFSQLYFSMLSPAGSKIYSSIASLFSTPLPSKNQHKSVVQELEVVQEALVEEVVEEVVEKDEEEKETQSYQVQEKSQSTLSSLGYVATSTASYIIKSCQEGSKYNLCAGKTGNVISVLKMPGKIALYTSIQNNHYLGAKILLFLGTDPNIKILPNKHQDTLLHLALGRGYTEIAELLIKNGADVNAQNKVFQTLLHLALYMGYTKIAELLIEKGADVNAQNKALRTPLHLALERGYTEIAKLLIENGFDINARNNEGITALHYAALHNNIDTIKCLIQQGADVNAKDNTGQTALHYAALHNNIDTIKYLIQQGADVNAKDNTGQTALHYAALYNKIGAIKCLIQQGAKIAIKDNEGLTPMKIAIATKQYATSFLIYETYIKLPDNHVLDKKLALDDLVHLKVTLAEILTIILWQSVNSILESGNKAELPLSKPLESNEELEESEEIDEEEVAVEEVAVEEVVEKDEVEEEKDEVEEEKDEVEEEKDEVEENEETQSYQVQEKSQSTLSSLGYVATSTASNIIKSCQEGSKYNLCAGKTRNVISVLQIPGKIALYTSIKNNHYLAATILLFLGADPNIKILPNKHQKTPLHLALYICNTAIAELLIKSGANINAQNKALQTPLHLALYIGNTAIAELLIDNRANVNAKNKELQTPLHLALERGYNEIAELLIENGADVNAKDGTDSTALHYAAKRENWEVLEVLIAYRADVNAKDGTDSTALHYAAQYSSWQALEVLMKARANVNAKDGTDSTALHYAAQYSSRQALEVLIAYGADVNAQNKVLRTPLHYAAKCGNWEVLEALIAAGADVNAKDGTDSTALHYAAQYRKLRVLEVLIAYGADVNAQNKEWQTPLHYAAQYRNWGVLEALITTAGINVNAQDQKGKTALHYAALHNQIDVIESLIQKGAKITIKDNEGRTPMTIALDQGREYAFHTAFLIYETYIPLSSEQQTLNKQLALKDLGNLKTQLANLPIIKLWELVNGIVESGNKGAHTAKVPLSQPLKSNEELETPDAFPLDSSSVEILGDSIIVN